MLKSSPPLKDLARLLLLIVLLPLIILLVGPLLVASAILGSISVFGVVKLAPGRGKQRGRLWALITGLLLWLLIWGGAIWVWLNYAPTAALKRVAPAAPTTQAFQPGPSPTTGAVATSDSTPTPTATIVIATNTPTSSATPSPTVAPSNTPIVLTPANTPVASPTSTKVVAAPQVSPAASTPTPLATLTPENISGNDNPAEPVFAGDGAGAFNAIAGANNLLVTAIEAPTDENLAALEGAWQGQAFDRVSRFARQVNQKYQTPLQVRYSIVGLPKLITDTTSSDLSVQSREFWVFESSDRKREVLNEYNYVLQQQNGKWVITFYQFEYIPLPTSPNTITGTEVITF